ncbi:8937_t:CDS:10, partial [Ambispora leptoticha]
MIANLNWPKITNELLPRQSSVDRPDLIARVFELKCHALLNDIKTNNIFEKVAAYIYTIKFQKRGLPHMHFLIFLYRDDKIKEPSNVNCIVSAEFLDPDSNPILFDIILHCMVHGSCRAYADGYPHYARRDNSCFNIGNKTINNRDIVPYNLTLSRKYNCHINIEVCASVKAVKYIHKYIYKDHNRATIYIGAPEAAWRLFEMHLHEEVPNVVRLALHLPKMYQIVFELNDDASNFLSQENQFSQHFVWNKTTRKWMIRKQGFAIGSSTICSGSQLRTLFTIILTRCTPTFPERLWLKYRNNICDNLSYRLYSEYSIETPTENQIYDYGLFLIDKILLASNKLLSEYPSMSMWNQQLMWDHKELQNLVNTHTPLLNTKQYATYQNILNSVTNNHGNLFFLNGPAGTGKTFVYNMLAITVHNEGKIALCVAFSGIAALLLIGGRTAHSLFKILININELSICSFDKNSDLAELLHQTALIIWDEAPMQHHYCFDAVDRFLCDICDDDHPFGGITVVFGESEENKHFANWLLNVGNGLNIELDNRIILSEHMKVDPDISSLINKIYPNIQLGAPNDTYLKDQMILSARNDDVHNINYEVLNIFLENKRIYLSADKAVIEEGADNGNIYLIEYLNTLNPSEMPPAKLTLKIGFQLTDYVIEACILSGNHTENLVFISRITLKPSSTSLLFIFTRRQFPIRLAFAITINKSQSQFLAHVGLDLRTSVFSYSQLYVALSRCISPYSIKALFPFDSSNNTTLNVVYPE